MTIHIPSNDHGTIPISIDAVEFIRKDNGERIGLCLGYGDQAELDHLLSFNWSGGVVLIIDHAGSVEN